MTFKDIGGFLIFSSSLALLLLLVFGVLQWLHIPSGSFLDWMIGIASFWWLLVIVTVPWNIHFAAKKVLTEADESRQRGIPVEVTQLNYVGKVARWSFWSAIALHGLSALGLYGLAAGDVSAIGYIGSIAALLLTGLRPAVSLCQYLIDRLQTIQRIIKYPREDVVDLKQRLAKLETTLTTLAYQLNLDTDDSVEHPDSWATMQKQTLAALRRDFTQLAVGIEDLRVTNQADHDRLAREARNAIAQLSTDSQFLEHVREIIRFFKAA
ncbi:MAG: hypothetical protein ACFBSF_12015 [Leptolyngbyaceae cyanobacterium]